MKPILLSPPHVSGNEFKYLKEAFESNWIAPIGPFVDRFEKQFASQFGFKNSVALCSGTAGLHLALRLSGVERGDLVYCSTFTFIASVSPVVQLGAEPVFLDSDRSSWNLDPDLLASVLKDAAKRNRLPKALAVVHLYGQTADMKRIMDICNEYDVTVVEDAAEALGATCHGQQPGGFGKFGIFSFNGNKIITTSGGGMLVAQDTKLADKARFLATQAREPAPHYEHIEIGYNYRLSNLLAAVGVGQLEVLADRVATRRRTFAKYQGALGDLPGIGFMPEASYGTSSRWLSCVTIDPKKAGITREDVRLALAKDSIESRPLWKPMHLQPVFRDAPRYLNGVSEELFANGLCLPSGTAMTNDEFDRIVGIVRSTWKV